MVPKVRAVVLLARNGLLRHGRSLIGLAVVVALGIGAAIASLGAAWRTDHAYPEYLRRAEVADVVVNPSLLTDHIVEVIASAPGVLDVMSDSLLTATPDDGAPRTYAELTNDGFLALQVRSSADGRYLRGDRPVVHAGRMIRSGPEAFLNLELAGELGLGVGDELPLAFREPPTAGRIDPNEVLRPLGQTRVKVVGVGVLADEVLPDGLYPRQRILVTPEVAAPFECAPPEHPSADDGRALEDLVDRLLPAGCSTSYRYFSLRVAGGEAGVAAVTAHLTERFAEESLRLPAALRESNVGFFLIPAVTSEEASRVQRSLDPSVTALQALGLAAAASTVAVVVLAGSGWRGASNPTLGSGTTSACPDPRARPPSAPNWRWPERSAWPGRSPSGGWARASARWPAPAPSNPGGGWACPPQWRCPCWSGPPWPWPAASVSPLVWRRGRRRQRPRPARQRWPAPPAAPAASFSPSGCGQRWGAGAALGPARRSARAERP